MALARLVGIDRRSPQSIIIIIIIIIHPYHEDQLVQVGNSTIDRPTFMSDLVIRGLRHGRLMFSALEAWLPDLLVRHTNVRV